MQTELIEQPQAWSRPPDTPRIVFAKWLDNAGAGIGTVAFVGVLAWTASGGNWAVVAAWSLPLGIAAFGLLMVARSALDEAFSYADYRAMLADIDALTAQIADMEEAHDAECERLNGLLRAAQHDLNLARSENWARTAGPHSRPAVELANEATPNDPARADAQKLLERAYSGQNWGKDAMRIYCGMTSTQWAAARELLQRRGVITPGNKQTYLVPPSLSDALTALIGSE